MIDPVLPPLAYRRRQSAAMPQAAAVSRLEFTLPDGSGIRAQRCTGSQCNIGRNLIAEGSEPEMLLFADFVVREPAVSPSGRFLAYQSDESGDGEIYVRSYPDVDAGRWQVSSAGGYFPIWSKSRDVLYFVQPSTSTLMAVKFEEQAGFSAGKSSEVLDLSDYYWRSVRDFRNFDISSDDTRVLAARSQTERNKIVVVQNWFEELERLLPTLRD